MGAPGGPGLRPSTAGRLSPAVTTSTSGRPASRSRVATSPALAQTCRAASGSADTDGIRTSRSRSARADGRTSRMASLSVHGHGQDVTPWTQLANRWRSAAKRWAISVAWGSSGWRTITMPSRDQGGPPVPPRRAHREQVDRGDVVAVLGQQPVQALVAGDPAGPLGPLEDAGRVVVPIDRERDAPVRDRVRPAGEQVGVGGVVHHVDGAGAGRPGADLAEHHLAVGLAVPLHVGEPVGEPERPQHGAAELAAALQPGLVQVAQGHRDRADPLVDLGHQRAAGGTGRCSRPGRSRPRRWCRR